MIAYLWKTSKGYRLTPWRSPYLRWRIETYWGWHADEIDARRFWSFLWQHRSEMLRFLRWTSRMDHAGR